MSNYYFYIVTYYKSLASLIRLSINDKNKLDKNLSTKKMFKLITDVKYMKRISLILSNCYKIYFIESVDESFIICDQFISTASNYFNGAFSNISNRDIGVRGSTIFLPITKKYYAILVDKNFNVEYLEDNINVLSSEATSKINNIIYNNATEKVATIRNYDYKFVNVNSFGDESVYIVYSYGAKAWKKKKEIFFSDYEQEIYEMYFNFEWAKNKKLGKNEKCFCGSEKKYKKCCYDKSQRCFLIINNLKNKSIHNTVAINNWLGIEKSIEI